MVGEITKVYATLLRGMLVIAAAGLLAELFGGGGRGVCDVGEVAVSAGAAVRHGLVSLEAVSRVLGM